MSEIRKDIFGETPEIGDTIIFNPPHYKGLVYGICIGFSEKSKLPLVNNLHEESDLKLSESYCNSNFSGYRQDGYYKPKTGFVVKKSTSFKDRKIDN